MIIDKSIEATKSVYAPRALTINNRDMLLGDTYVKHLLVIQLPENFGFGLLSYYISNPKIRVSIKTKEYDGDISKALANRKTKEEQDYRNATDDILKRRIEQRLQSLDDFIDEYVTSRDSVLNLIMVFSVSANTKEELDAEVINLKRQLRNEGIDVDELSRMQEQLLKVGSPLFIDHGIHPDIERNFGIPITANSFSGMWPYSFATIRDAGGVFLGSESGNGGFVQADPFYYYNNPELARLEHRSNGNGVFFGVSGSGKTTTQNQFVRWAIMNKISFISIDPENKNYHFTKKYHGEWYVPGRAGMHINPLDLIPVSYDEDEDFDEYDVQAAISDVVNRFKIIMNNYNPELKRASLDELDAIMYEVYRRKGFNNVVSFRGMQSSNFPIISDLIDVALEFIDDAIKNELNRKRDKLDDLVSAMKPMTLSDENYFNKHTTVKMNNKHKILSFGTKTLQDKPRHLKNAMYFIIFRFAWSFCLDASEFSMFFLDEAHDILFEGETLKECSTIWRRARKYLTAAWLSTQQPQDLSSDVLVNGVAASSYGKAILDNSTYRIIHQLRSGAVKDLEENLELSPNEIDSIMNYSTGEALMLFGDDKRMSVSVYVTDEERYEMDPDSLYSSRIRA